MKKQIISLTLVAAGFLLGATALSALAQTPPWNPPTQLPPNGNVAAPINVGSAWQSRVGALGIGASNATCLDKDASGNCITLDVTGSGLFSTLAVIGGSFGYNPTGVVGSVPAGQVLTSSGTNGAAVWATSGSSGGSNIVSTASDLLIATPFYNTTWTKANLGPSGLGFVPSNATAVILEGSLTIKGTCGGCGPSYSGSIQVAADNNGSPVGTGHVLATVQGTADFAGTGGNIIEGSDSNTMIISLNSSLSIDYQLTNISGTVVDDGLYVVGYIGPAPSALSVSGMSCTYTEALITHNYTFTFSGAASGGVTPYAYTVTDGLGDSKSVTGSGIFISPWSSVQSGSNLTVISNDGQTAAVPCTSS